MPIKFTNVSMIPKSTTTGLPIENLVWYINDDDLNNGSVSEWSDRQLTEVDLVQTTAGNQPTKGSTGVTFDGNDFMAVAENTLTVSASYSIVLVGKWVDWALPLTETNGGIFIGLHDGSRNITLSTRFDGTNNFITGYYYPGSGPTESFDILSTSYLDSLICVILTRSVENGIKMYINGTDIVASSTYLGIGQDVNSLTLGHYGGGFSVINSGSIIRLAALYDEELSQTKINTIMASNEIQNKID